MGDSDRTLWFAAIVGGGVLAALGGYGLFYLETTTDLLTIEGPLDPSVYRVPAAALTAGIGILAAGILGLTVPVRVRSGAATADTPPQTGREHGPWRNLKVRRILVLVLADAMVVAGVGAYAFSTIPTPPPWVTFCPRFKPYVSLSAAQAGSAETVTVTSMSQGTPPDASCYLVNLQYNGTFGEAVRLPTGSNGTVSVSFVGGAPRPTGPFTIRWTDTDGDGRVALNDTFMVTYAGGLPGPALYAFYLLWSDGSTLTFAQFSRP